MPELPEVETIARTLAPSLAGRSIVSVEALNKGTWQGPVGPQDLRARLPLPVAGTGRRGKVLLVYVGAGTLCDPASLSEDRPGDGLSAENRPAIRALAFHLKMTGRIFAYPAGVEPGPHTRVVFGLDDGSRLFFDDARKFGYVRAVTAASLRDWPFWRKLGPEPFALDDSGFAALFRERHAAIKALLLQQEILAGIGNIYADESLFRAGIRPSRPGRLVGEERLSALRRALVEVLEESIRACGSSIRDYRTARGDAGSFQNAFRVYGRAGQPCLVCGRKLRKEKIAGRSTVFCPHCQK